MQLTIQLRGSTKFEHTIDFVEAVTRYADLEGWWKFEDNLNDSSGNDRTGAHSGTNKYENLGSIGKFGNGLYLDGTGEHISITGYKGITGGAARTMAAWIKTDFSKAPILNWETTQPVRNGLFVFKLTLEFPVLIALR